MSIISRNIARIKNALQLDGRTETIGAETFEVILKDSRGILLAYGDSVPTDAGAGFATGCIFIDTNGTAGSIMYANEGTAASCDFNTSLVSGDISSVTAGAGMTGGGASGAVTLNVIADESSIEVTADEIHVKALGIVTAMIAAGAIDATKLNAAEAVTVTADGLTTGIVSVTARFVTVTSDDANKILTLPASVVGKVIKIVNGATGYEIRTTAASSIKINDVVSGSTTELAIPATTLVTATCVSATEWVVTAVNKLGVVITPLVADAV